MSRLESDRVKAIGALQRQVRNTDEHTHTHIHTDAESHSNFNIPELI